MEMIHTIFYPCNSTRQSHGFIACSKFS